MRLPDFSRKNVAVVGDVMVDKYVVGDVSRISPEAPVPVVRVRSERYVAGGASNVACNVSSLGGNAHLFGLVGDDNLQEKLKDLVAQANVKADLVPCLPCTITKTRVIGSRQQIARLDYESDNFAFTDVSSNEVLQKFLKVLPTLDCVVISDYGKGMFKSVPAQTFIQHSRKQNVPVIVDPKGFDWSPYVGATVVTPNLKELGEAFGGNVANEDAEVEAAAKALIDKFNLRSVLVTRSDKGMSFVSKEETVHMPTENIEVFDVSGAGDTVVATIALLLSSEFTWQERLHVANKSAGIVVGKLGTAQVSFKELQSALLYGNNPDKHSVISDWEQLGDIVEMYRSKGRQLVFTNGCFDILHRGHVTYLEKARELGDVLILGLNTDNSVKRLKGEGRPINSELDRAFVLSRLASVDHVVLFDQETPYGLIELVRPDVLVKGGDYKVEQVVGREFARKTVILDFVDGYSTTTIINKSKEN